MINELREFHNTIPQLRAYARAITRNPDQADDLVQACLERALAKQAQFQPGTNLRAWMFTILRNMYINDMRKRRWQFVPANFDSDEHAVTVDGAQENALRVRDLRRALARLSPEDRAVLRLIGEEGHSYTEAAATLDLALGTIRSRLSRARVRLRALMEGGLDAGSTAAGQAH